LKKKGLNNNSVIVGGFVVQILAQVTRSKREKDANRKRKNKGLLFTVEEQWETCGLRGESPRGVSGPNRLATSQGINLQHVRNASWFKHTQLKT